jgi:rod shape-determining protein MreD
VAGFVGGLLVDTATLGTLGVTSLLLAVAGHWAGRYGETTGRGRPYAPYVAVAVIAVLVGVGGFVVHFLLGDAVSARLALPPVLPSAVLDVLLVWPVYALCRRCVGSGPVEAPPREVELVV